MNTISRPAINRHMADDDCEAAAYATGRAGQPLRIARPLRSLEQLKRTQRLRQAWHQGLRDRRKAIAMDVGVVVAYIAMVITAASFVHSLQ